jgi:hypothetical protein
MFIFWIYLPDVRENIAYLIFCSEIMDYHSPSWDFCTPQDPSPPQYTSETPHYDKNIMSLETTIFYEHKI